MRTLFNIVSNLSVRRLSPQLIRSEAVLKKEIRRTTATMTLKSLNIPVKLPEGLSEEKLLAFSPFKNWLKTLTHSLSVQHINAAHPFHHDPYSLRSITVQSFDLFGRSPNQRLGFLKLVAEVSNGAGETLPGSVFLRGPSVAMLVILKPENSPLNQDERADEYGDRYVILTVQPRIPAGSLQFAELPAGMLDEGGSFVGTAVQEIHEELGLDISMSELRCLSHLAATEQQGVEGNEDLPYAMYPSAGGCDEHMLIFMCEHLIPRDKLKEWTGKFTGLRDQGEKITLKLVRFGDLWKEGSRDAKCLAALALWDGLRREKPDL